LTLMGATKASLAIMNIKIVKDVRNKANRVTNCDTANIAKSVEASIRQMEDIQLIAETRGLDTLPEALQFAAQLRIKNPDASLRELCESTEPVISRSGMNHRFKKIHEVAEQIRKMQ
ncbi:MAG TPA: DNA-binding protein WhiA, partial [Firmicutes bacterium]|nr:DNA-binding protein WhiA [Bacillota bacterium]